MKMGEKLPIPQIFRNNNQLCNISNFYIESSLTQTTKY